MTRQVDWLGRCSLNSIQSLILDVFECDYFEFRLLEKLKAPEDRCSSAEEDPVSFQAKIERLNDDQTLIIKV